MKDYQRSEPPVGVNFISRGKSPSTWLGYKTVSKKFREFLLARLETFPPRMKEDWGHILDRWDITIPPHLPPTTLLCDHELALFVLYSHDVLGNGKSSIDKVVSWQNESSRDMAGLPCYSRRDFRAAVKILRTEDWYRRHTASRAKIVPVHFLSSLETLRFDTLDVALPLLVFFIGAYGGGRISDLHNKIRLDDVTVEHQTIFGQRKPILKIELPELNDKGNGGFITFQCTCSGSHKSNAKGVCNKLLAFEIVYSQVKKELDLFLSTKDRETGQLHFRTSAGKGSFKYITRDPADWKKGVRLFNRLRISGKSGKILGFYVGGVKNHGLSKAAITKQYHRALELAGMSQEEAKQYKYHGLRRTTATLQMEYGDNLPESEVMKATRHSSERSFRLYNQESAQKLARHANRQTDIAFLTGVISDWRQTRNENPVPNPVEVQQLREAIVNSGYTISMLRNDSYWTTSRIMKFLLGKLNTTK